MDVSSIRRLLKQSEVAATYQSKNYVESKGKRGERLILVIIIMATYYTKHNDIAKGKHLC